MPTARIVVVGAGPAGVAAATQCQRLGGAPLLLDRRGAAGGLIADGYLVENYPGLERPLPGREFAARLAAQLARFEVAVERAAVRRIAAAADAWRIVCDTGELTASAVILATGTAPRALEVDADPAARGRLFHGIEELWAAVPRPRRVLVIGGGEAAFDYALSLAARGAAVELAIRGPEPRARGRLRELVARTPTIAVRLSTRVLALGGGDAGVLARLAGGDGPLVREVDAALAAVGRRSTVGELLGGTGSALDAGSLTPKPGLFICGDARLGSLGQAGIAVGDGLAAAALAVERAARVSE